MFFFRLELALFWRNFYQFVSELSVSKPDILIPIIMYVDFFSRLETWGMLIYTKKQKTKKV